MLEKPSRAGVKRENQPEAVNPHPLGGGWGGGVQASLCVLTAVQLHTGAVMIHHTRAGGVSHIRKP